MACIITYENKQYTQKEFKQYFREHFTEFVGNFLGSKQDIQGFKDFINNKNKQDVDILSLEVDKNLKTFYQLDKNILKDVYEKNNRNLIINKFYNDNTLISNLDINKHFLGLPENIISYFKFITSKKTFTTVKDLIYYTYSDFFKNDYYSLSNLPVDENLETKLKTFLNKYHITISEKTKKELRNKYGLNILGVFDIINKTIEIVTKNKRNITTLPEEASHAIIEIIGSSYKHSEKYRELSDLVSSWEGYNTIYKEYSKIYTDSLGNPDWKLIKKEAIGKALSLALIEAENPEIFKKPKEEQKLLSKIKSLFIKIIDFLAQDFRSAYKNKEFKNLINEIAKNVLNENYNFFDVIDSSDFNTLLYEDTIEAQNLEDGGKALEVMQIISKHKGMITGSLAIRKLGELKRKTADNLHDIDVIISSKNFNPSIQDIFNINLQQISESSLVKSLKNKFGNELQLFSNWSNKFENYAAIHFYITEDPNVTDYFSKKEGRLSELYENLTDLQKKKTILIDVFIDDKFDYKPIYENKYNINLTPVYASFIAKIFNMGRKKDIFDYQTLKYYKESYKTPVPDKRNYLFQIDEKEDYEKTIFSKTYTETRKFDYDNNIDSYFNDGETTIDEILTKIKNPALLPLVKLLQKYILPSQRKISVKLINSPDADYAGMYYSDSEGIRIEINRGAKFANGSAEGIILHEIIHALTLGYLNNNKGSKLYKDLEKLFEYTKTSLEAQGKDYYGLSNIEEFVTESLTNSSFIKELLQLEALDSIKYPNLLEQFLNKIYEIFKSILNIKDDNVYEQITSIIGQILENNQEDFYNPIIGETFYAAQTVDNETTKDNHEFSDYLNESTENEEKFISIISNLKKRFNDYITLLEEGAIDYPSSDKEIKLKDLKQLRKLLKDNNIDEAIIGLNKYVVQSVNWIDIIYKEFFESDEFPSVVQRVKALSGLENNSDEVYKLSRIINKSTQFLYLFQGLADFKNELQREGFVPKDKFNSKFFGNLPLFKNRFKSYLKDDTLETLHKAFELENLTTAEFKTSIINAIINERDTLTAKEVENIRKDVDDIIKEETKKTFTSQMSEALGKASKLQDEIKNIHYKLVTEWLYPEFNALQSKYYDTSNEKYVTKKQFEAMLKVANEDENFFTSWLEATIQTKDPLVSTVAKKISNALNEVHKKNILVADEIGKIREDFKKQSVEEQKKSYEEFTNYIDVLETDLYGDPIEIDINDERDGITINTLEGKKKYLTKKVKAFKTGIHTSLLEAERNLVTYLLYRNKEGKEGLIKTLLSNLTDEDGNINYAEFRSYLIANSKNIPELYTVAQRLYGIVNNGISANDTMVDYVEDSDDKIKTIKGVIESVLWKELYYSKVGKNLNVEETTAKIKALSPDNFEEFISNNAKQNSNLNTLLYLLSKKDTGAVVAIHTGGVVKYLVKNDLGEFEYLSERELKAIKDVTGYSFFYKTGELVTVADRYILPTYNGKYVKYFNQLYELYQEHNKLLGKQRLKHGIIPQIEKAGIEELSEITGKTKSLLTSIYEWFVDAYNSIKEAWKALNNDPEFNEEKKSTFELEYLNGDKVKSVAVQYNKILDNQENVEWDLGFSVGAYAFMVNKNQVLKQYDPQMKVITSIIKGDIVLGMQQRQAKKTDIFNRVIKRRKGRTDDEENFKRVIAENLNAKIIEFIDDMVYNESDYLTFGLGKITSKGLESTLSKYVAYTNLAFGITGMLSNLSNGKISTYLEAIQGKYFTLDEYWEAEKEYYKNSANHFKDFMTSDLKDKSKIGQLLVILDAIQGEYLDDFQSVLQKKKWSDAPNTALFFTQNGAEHYIQTVNMIAMLKAEGLWDSIEYKEGKVLEFTADEWKKLKEFQGKLHSVNKRLNGAYSKIDKARLQRRWFGRLLLTFRKYIWQMYKARFGSERLDIESGDLVRGYVSSYYEQLIKDLKSNQSVAWKAMRGVKQLGLDTRRFALGTVNTLSFNQLNKNKYYKKLYSYDGMSEEQIAEARRYIAEVSMYSVLTLVAAFLGSLEDDDEEKGILLGNLELLAKRQRNDMGAFLPTMLNVPVGGDIGLFNTFDFIRKTVSSPIPAMRSMDNSISVLSQLTGLEYKDGQFNATFNDVYERSGMGYEKGDYKITRKLEKSIVSPYWQLIKFMNPQEQINYLSMVNKNSK